MRNPKLARFSLFLLISLWVLPALALEVEVSDFYRTDGFIHELLIVDSYILWIESPEDNPQWADLPGSPLDIFISDGTVTSKISSPGMRPILPAGISSQFGRVAWFGQGADLPTDDVYLILYDRGINTPISSICSLADIPWGIHTLKCAMEWPMIAFGKLIENGSELFQHIMLWQNGHIEALVPDEFHDYSYCPAIDSQRIVWCTSSDTGRSYIELWEGGSVITLAEIEGYRVANTSADGRLILWNQTESEFWSPTCETSTIWGWDESSVSRICCKSVQNGHRSQPYHNRRSATWHISEPGGAGSQIWILKDTFSNTVRKYPVVETDIWEPGYIQDPVISESFFAIAYKLVGYNELLDESFPEVQRLSSTEIWLEWGVQDSDVYYTETPYNEYMVSSDYPHVAWVRDEGVSRVIVLSKPIVDTHIEMDLNQIFYHSGDEFLLKAEVDNNSDALISDLYVALEVGGEFWFWPSWNEIPVGRVTELPGYDLYEETILDFTFPQVDHVLTGLRFWGALFWQATYVLIDYDSVTWGYGP